MTLNTFKTPIDQFTDLSAASRDCDEVKVKMRKVSELEYPCVERCWHVARDEKSLFIEHVLRHLLET